MQRQHSDDAANGKLRGADKLGASKRLTADTPGAADMLQAADTP